MGMSASQARFLSLTARKNNVEFEGQQINQQRTTLSNESASYYAELCNMVVPTPPSIDDFTKVSYTFDDGALTNTITTMIAKENNRYSISYIQQWQDDYSIVSAASSIIGVSQDEENENVYKIGSSTLRLLGIDIDIVNPENNSDPYLKSLSSEQLKELEEQELYYQTMLNEKVNSSAGANEKWFVRYVKDSNTGSYVPYFYNEEKVKKADYADGFAVSSVDCYSIGSSIKTKEVINALGSVEKDSTGRYISILLFQTDENGNIKKDDKGNDIYTQYSLVTNTTTDEDAYNDAMNKYNYEQYQYDQKIQDINSKIEIVQQQDKALELQLKQLDTEENAISTEMEAVKKVITKNIETSFKTFNA